MSSPGKKTPATKLYDAESIDELDKLRQALLGELEHFHSVQTKEDLQARYKMLAKKLHPDAGGSDAAFTVLRNELDQWLAIEEIYTPLRVRMERYPDVFCTAVQKSPISSTSFAERVRKNLSKKETRQRVSKAAGVVVGEIAQAAIDGLLRRR